MYLSRLLSLTDRLIRPLSASLSVCASRLRTLPFIFSLLLSYLSPPGLTRAFHPRYSTPSLEFRLLGPLSNRTTVRRQDRDECADLTTIQRC